MKEWLIFLADIGDELVELFEYVRRGQPDPEEEKQIAARLIRKASDERARREIGGA